VSLEKLEALEVRVRKLVDLFVELRKEKTQLEKQLQLAREGLDKHKELLHVWEKERKTWNFSHLKANRILCPED